MFLLQDFHVFYGPSHVVHGVSLEVREGDAVALIGRNGVGKTTLLKGIMNLVPDTTGVKQFDGKDISPYKPYEIAKLGISYVPEHRGIFPYLTVRENLFLGLANSRDRQKDVPREVYEAMPILEERGGQLAGTLSGGEQQILAIARGLAGRPRLMLIDEFSEGIQPTIVQGIAAYIRRINAEGVGILIVEQNARLALRIASRGYVMEKGQIVAHGSSEDLLADETLLQKHLVI